MRRAAAITSLVAAVALASCGPGTEEGSPVKNGKPEHGAQLIGHYGCGSCHTIGGIDGANGKVGPPLTGIDKRHTIAGKLANTPENLIRWIMDPQKIVPGNDMPDLGVKRDEARDIAAYLYTH
jgi:cytochrome c2